MFRAVIPVCIGVCYLLLAIGCSSAERVESHSVMGRFQFLWYDDGQVSRLLNKTGYTNTSPKYASMRRDSKGERLFIDLKPSQASSMLAIISAECVRVKELHGFGSVNDAEQQLCWLDLRDHQWHFATGYTLQTNEHVLAASGGYVIVADNPRTRQWIAAAETPTNVLISLPANFRVERLFARNQVLDVFYFQYKVKGAGGEMDELLHLTTYSLEGEGPKVQRSREFPWASRVFDMDPEGRVAMFRPRQTYFAHGILAELDTGRKFRLGVAGDNGVFLGEAVIRRFRELSKP